MAHVSNTGEALQRAQDGHAVEFAGDLSRVPPEVPETEAFGY